MAVIFSAAMPALAQHNSFTENYYPEARLHYGFILPHTTKIEYLVRGHVPAFEASLVRYADSSNACDRLYHYPSRGVTFFHAGFQYPEVLGSANSLVGFLNVPVVSTSGGLSLDYQVSSGLSWITGKFDLVDNNLNVAIGSHINLHLSMLVDVRRRFGDHLEWSGGCSFTHFSNGRIRLPNLGLNYVSVFTGIGFRFDQPRQANPAKDAALPKDRTISSPDKKFEHMVVVAIGIKQYEITDEDFYRVNTLYYDLGRRLGPLMKVSLGADVFYDASTRNHFENNGTGDYHTTQLCSAGVHAGWHLTYRKVTGVVMAGHYLYNGTPPPSSLYGRIGLQYRCTDHLSANVSLKAHNAIADFVEWGLAVYL